MPTTPRIRSALAAALLSLLLGCGMAPSASDSGDLVMALNNYTRMIRWQRWSDAATFVPQAQQGAWLEQKLQGAQGLNIADVGLAGVNQDSSQSEEATVFVRIAWYRLPDPTLRESVWKQAWKLERGEGWRLQSEALVEAPASDVPPPSWP